MNIDRYWTQVEDANWYDHIYRSTYWHPAWIHSTPLSAKGKTLPTLNHSLVTQQPEISCQSYCCALISEENGGGECLHLWAFWPTGTVYSHESLGTGSRNPSFALERGRECICLPQAFLGEKNKICFCSRWANRPLENYFMSCVDTAWVSQ